MNSKYYKYYIGLVLWVASMYFYGVFNTMLVSVLIVLIAGIIRELKEMRY